MQNTNKSNEIYSQYIAKELLDALAVFLDSSENDEVVKNAMVIAKEFGGSKDITLLISGNEDEKVPSFTITSIDLTDVYAITSIYKEEYDRDVLYAVNEDGTNSIMKFMLESDNEDFKRYVEENVVLSCYTAKWIAEEYLALEDPSFVYKTDDIPYAYQQSLSNYFTNSREYMIFRVKDGKVFSIDEQSSWILHYSPMFWRYNSHILYQPTYYLSRKLYNSDSIYFHDDKTSSGKAPVYRLDFNGNKITGESVFDFSGSQFDPNFGQILVDKNNNLLTYDDGIGYILCSDKSIVPFNTPELAAAFIEEQIKAVSSFIKYLNYILS